MSKKEHYLTMVSSSVTTPRSGVYYFSQGWKLIDGALEKPFAFPNFHATMAFVNALAWVAHREDHHPDLAVSYGRCTVRFNTHDVGGISVRDFHCAAAVDALLKA